MTYSTEETQSNDWSAELRRVLMTYFNEGDLEILCFDLRVDYENLPGDNKSKKIIELILYFSRSGKIAELIDRCKELRPNVEWEKLKEAAIRDPLIIKHIEDGAIEFQPPDELPTAQPSGNIPNWVKSFSPWMIIVIVLIVVGIFLIFQWPTLTASTASAPTTTNLSNATQPTVLISTTTPSSELSDCRASLGIDLSLSDPVADDELQIRSLMDAEAEAVRDRDTDRLMALYWEDASVTKPISGGKWVGCNAIRNRYEMLLFTLTFTSLTHEIIELTIDEDSGRAEAITRVIGEYILDNPYEEELAIIDYLDNERWTFIKVQDSWKIKSFVYGLPEE